MLVLYRNRRLARIKGRRAIKGRVWGSKYVNECAARRIANKVS